MEIRKANGEIVQKSGRYGPRGPYTKRKVKESKTSDDNGKSSEAEISIDGETPVPK